MTQNDVLKAEAKSVLSLRAASPKGWDDFLSVMRARSALLDTELVRSSPDKLQFNQGRAAEMRVLLSELEGAVTLAEQIYEKERRNGYPAAR